MQSRSGRVYYILLCFDGICISLLSQIVLTQTQIAYYYITYCKRYEIPECIRNQIVLDGFVRRPDDSSKQSKHVALKQQIIIHLLCFDGLYCRQRVKPTTHLDYMVLPIAPRLQTCTACYCTEYCRSAFLKLFSSGDHFHQSECSTNHPTLGIIKPIRPALNSVRNMFLQQKIPLLLLRVEQVGQ